MFKQLMECQEDIKEALKLYSSTCIASECTQSSFMQGLVVPSLWKVASAFTGDVDAQITSSKARASDTPSLNIG